MWEHACGRVAVVAALVMLCVSAVACEEGEDWLVSNGLDSHLKVYVDDTELGFVPAGSTDPAPVAATRLRNQHVIKAYVWEVRDPTGLPANALEERAIDGQEVFGSTDGLVFCRPYSRKELKAAGLRITINARFISPDPSCQQ